jgi:hypothetical protein
VDVHSISATNAVIVTPIRRKSNRFYARLAVIEVVIRRN